MGISSVLFESLTGNLTAWLVFVIIFLVTYAVWQYIKPSPYKVPPGPRPLPILGNALHLLPREGDPSGAIRTWKWAKENNADDVFMYFGKAGMLIMHDYDDIKNTLAKEEFSARVRLNMPENFKEFIFNGIIGSEGERWKEQRRFALSTLRDFGLGKNKLELIIHAELDKYNEQLANTKGQAVDMMSYTNAAVSNVICNLVFGHRFEYSDPEFKNALALMDENFNENFLKAFPAFLFPPLRFIPGDPFRIHRLLQVVKEIHSGILYKEYHSHLDNFDPNNIDDFIDAFIKEMKSREGKDGEEHWFTVGQLFNDIDDMFQAGTETTSTTLRWVVAVMLCYPDVQKRVREEIHNAVGHDRMPSMRDKVNMPYMEATLAEIRRMWPLVPTPNPGTFEQPTPYKNYMLPPRTVVRPNVYAIHYDPNYWDDPHTFTPDRFLDEQGKFKGDDRLLTFSIGKRVCLGEGLARMELFLFSVAILQRYQLELPQGASKPSLQPAIGATNPPRPFKVCFVSD